MSVVGMMLGRCVQVFLQMRANKRWIGAAPPLCRLCYAFLTRQQWLSSG